MFRTILHRLLVSVPLALGASFITFSILYFVPGDPVTVMLGDRAHDPVLVAKMRHELRLDDPFPVRYARFLGGLVQGDLGRSHRTARPVISDLAEALPASAELALAGLAVSLFIGLISGIVSGLRPNSALDHSLMVVALVGVSIPVFWLALLVGWLFATPHPEWGYHSPLFSLSGRLGGDYWGYQPRSGFAMLDALYYRDARLLLNALRHLALPALTLGLIGSALIARMTRSAILEIKGRDFIRTARAKGLPPRKVVRHILSNAMLPVVTVVGLQFGALLGGAIITEEIFAWPGAGTYLILAIRHRDITAVQGSVMAVVLLFLLVNLIVDLLYAAIDPRTGDEGA